MQITFKKKNIKFTVISFSIFIFMSIPYKIYLPGNRSRKTNWWCGQHWCDEDCVHPGHVWAYSMLLFPGHCREEDRGGWEASQEDQNNCWLWINHLEWNVIIHIIHVSEFFKSVMVLHCVLIIIRFCSSNQNMFVNAK